jgi:hypothetical protein
MHRLVWTTLAACLTCTAVRADDAAEARAVLDKGIKALGGADKLEKLPATSWKSTGSFTAGDQKVEITDTWTVQGHTKFRWELEASFNGMTQRGVLVMNGDEGWGKGGPDNKTEDIPKEVLPMLKADMHTARLVELLLPFRDKGFTLSHLGELKINDKTCVGIKIKHKDYPDVDLYFDKDTGLPTRSEMRVKEPQASDEITHAFYFSDYKEFGGRMFATKVVLKRDDKPAMEMTRSDVQPKEKADDSDFAKP